MLLLVYYSKFIKRDIITRIGNYGFLVVLTESMEPNIEKNEFIIISNNKDYQKGDIITYIDFDNVLITHRIIEKREKTVITKGDNNDIVDFEIENAKVQGEVIFHSKIIGIFVLYCLKKIIIIYLILLIVFFVKDIYLGGENIETKKKE